MFKHSFVMEKHTKITFFFFLKAWVSLAVPYKFDINFSKNN